MSILDIFNINKIKAEWEKCRLENEQLRGILTSTEKMTYVELHHAVERLNGVQNDLENQIKSLNGVIGEKKKEIILLDDEVLLQSFGFYKTRYALNNSEQYKAKLDEIRAKQEKMVKDGKAAFSTQSWSVNGSQKEGERMAKDYVKLILRSFNNECDASIINVKFNNIESYEKKIRKAHETLNKLGQRMNIVIATEYLTLKLQELYLCYEYQVKKQEEKEEQRKLKEQMREEAKLIKEIEEAKLQVEKEEKHFCKALLKLSEQLGNARTETERQDILEKKGELEKKLAGLERDKLNILNREQNTRAGYVYIISNIGAFGENVYKIGVTRRLEPADRVDELGDASVPFEFDIHAMIFSDDAPKLEWALHKAFEHRRLNLINNRREFFQVTLNDIEAEVKKNHNKVVEFVRIPEASQYRESIMLRSKTVAPIV